MTKTRTPLTAEERAKRRREQHERLEQATGELLSSAGWRRWLRARAVLHGYSLNNTMLIAAECERRGIVPTHVAGFKNWMKLGRCVRKGEKGIPIFAPMRVKVLDQDGEQSEQRRVLFRVVSVFDFSQTDALPGQPDAPFHPPIASLEGDSHFHLLERLLPFSAEIGYPAAFEELPPGILGLCNHRKRHIKIEPRIAANAQVATLIHESAHALVGPQSGFDYDTEEVAVESVAYIVSAGAGLDTGPFSSAYVASWGGKDPLEALRATAELVDRLARRIEAAIEPPDTEADSCASTPKPPEECRPSTRSWE